MMQAPNSILGAIKSFANLTLMLIVSERLSFVELSWSTLKC